MSDGIPIVQGTIYVQCYDEADARQSTCMRGSSDLHGDFHIMDTAVEFRYAAIRQNKALIVDMVPRWKVPLLKMLGVKFRTDRGFHG